MLALFRFVACLAGTALVVVLGAGPGHAGLVTNTFVGTDAPTNFTREATAVFAYDAVNSPGVLHLTLSNSYQGSYGQGTPTGKVDVTYMLTALFFDIHPEAQLILTSAMVSAGSRVINEDGSLSTTTNLLAPTNDPGQTSGPTQGGWQYKYNPAQVSQDQGLGTVGLQIFDGGDVGTQGNGQADYALAIASWAPSMGGNNGSIKYPVISDSIDFTLQVPGTFDVRSISNVRFQYGTQLSDKSVVVLPGVPGSNPPPAPIPEPATFFGVLIAAGGAVVRRVRMRRRAAA